MRARITDSNIKTLKPGARLGDDKVPGFGVVRRPSGSVRFFLDFLEHGRRRRTFSGAWPTWTVAAAREHAAEMRRALDRGESPLPAKQEAVTDLLDRWLEVVHLRLRPETSYRYGRHVDRFIRPAFGRRLAHEVGFNEVELFHAKLGRETPSQANLVAATLSSFFRWAKRDGLVAVNPCAGLQRFPSVGREVFLDAVEMSVASEFLSRHQRRRSAALTLLVCLATGCRVGEALSIRDPAHRVDLENRVWRKPSSHTKDRKNHAVPLRASVVPFLQELLALPRPPGTHLREVLLELRALLNRPELRVHDLRHSHASQLVRAGGSLFMVGKVLGHSHARTTERYSHLVDGDLRELVERAAEETPALRRVL